MAKLKNLFIGCPVQVKQGEVGTVASIDKSDNTAWVSFPLGVDSVDDWHDIEDLKLAPFLELEKVNAHIERFA